MGLFSSITSSLGLTEQRTFGGINVPSLEDIPNVVNTIFGVESRIEEFERADGTKGTRLVTTGTSPEQNEFIQQLSDQLISLNTDIQNLSSMTAAIDNEQFEPVIQAQREFQAEAREQVFKDRSRLEEEVLARRGLEDSTASQEAREQRGAALQDQIVQDERSLTVFAEDLRNQQLQRSAGALQTGLGIQGTLNQAGQQATGTQMGLGQLQLGQGQLGLQNEAAIFQSRLAAQQQQGQNFTNTLTAGAGFFGNPFAGLRGIFGESTSDSPSQQAQNILFGG